MRFDKIIKKLLKYLFVLKNKKMKINAQGNTMYQSKFYQKISLVTPELVSEGSWICNNLFFFKLLIFKFSICSRCYRSILWCRFKVRLVQLI